MQPRSTLLLSLFFLSWAICGVEAGLGSKGNQELRGPKDRLLRARKGVWDCGMSCQQWLGQRAPRAWPGVCSSLGKSGSLSPQLLCELGQGSLLCASDLSERPGWGHSPKTLAPNSPVHTEHGESDLTSSGIPASCFTSLGLTFLSYKMDRIIGHKDLLRKLMLRDQASSLHDSIAPNIFWALF